jgi:hypothetical protein
MKRFVLAFLLCLATIAGRAQRCAVLNLQIGTGITSEDVEGISYTFRSNFRPADYTILDSFLIDRALRELNYIPTDMTFQQQLKVGRKLDASYIVVGNISKFMDEYSVNIHIVEVSTGLTKATQSDTFLRPDYRTKMESLANKLSESLTSSFALNPSSVKEESVSFRADGKIAMFQDSYYLNAWDGQYLNFTEDHLEEQEVDLAYQFSEEICNHPLLSDEGIYNYKIAFDYIIRTNIEGLYFSPKDIVHPQYVPLDYSNELNSICHKIIRNNSLREVLFNLSAKTLCKLCCLYPKDFKEEVIKHLMATKNLLTSLRHHSYAIVGDSLYLDGEVANVTIARSQMGFLIRRILLDGFTISEMNGYLDRLLSKVKTTDISGNSDFLRIVTINNTISCYVTASGYYFGGNNSGTIYLPQSIEKGYHLKICNYPFICCKMKDNGDVYYSIQADISTSVDIDNEGVIKTKE